MFGGSHSKTYVEQVFLQMGKDAEKTLDLFL